MAAQLTPYHEYLLKELMALYRLSARPVTARMLADHLGRKRKAIWKQLSNLQAGGHVARHTGPLRGYIPCTDNPELAQLTVEDYLLRKIDHLFHEQGYGVTGRRLAAHVRMSESATRRYLIRLEAKGLIARPDGWKEGYVPVNRMVQP